MLVAGLCAEGATELLDDGYIDRGYDRFDACLSALGADAVSYTHLTLPTNSLV